MQQRHAAVVEAEALVKEQLQKLPRDGSHDWWHIYRVHKTAVALAEEERIKGDSLLAVELAALLHDVQDWKYAEQQSDADRFSVKSFLESQPVSSSIRDTVLHILAHIRFSDELSRGGEQQASPELQVVQDADRLDAIGAIGIARCFTFGGKFGRTLHDPAVPPRDNLGRDEYKSRQQTTINHFYEKLLKLKGMMKSAAGRRRAESRHLFLQQYLEQFSREWEEDAEHMPAIGGRASFA